MRKNDVPRIKVQRPAKDTARGQKNMGIAALGDHFFGNHMAFLIGKNRQHALLPQMLHGHQQVREQRLPIGTQPCAGQFLPHPIMHEATHHQQRIDPRLVRLGGLPQVAVWSLGNLADRTEATQQARCQPVGLLMQRRQELGQMSVRLARERSLCMSVPKPVSSTAIHTGQRSMTA